MTAKVAGASSYVTLQLLLAALLAAPPAPSRAERPALPRLVAVAAGTRFTCALSAAGDAWCWGAGDASQLATDAPLSTCTAPPPDGSEIPCALHPVPVTMPPGVVFTQIAAGLDHACALDTDGAVWCWGSRLSVRPQRVGGDRRYERVAADLFETCALSAEGRVDCWGALGAPLPITTADADHEAAMAKEMQRAETSTVAVGPTHRCRIAAGGGVECMGANESGQLGNGTRRASAEFGPVAARDRNAIGEAVLTHLPSRSEVPLLVLAIELVATSIALGAWAPAARRRGVATAAIRARVAGVLSVALASGSWLIVLAALLDGPGTGGGHDDVSLGLAWLAMSFVVGAAALFAAAAAVGGYVALRADARSRLARAGIGLAAAPLLAGLALVALILLG